MINPFYISLIWLQSSMELLELLKKKKRSKKSIKREKRIERFSKIQEGKCFYCDQAFIWGQKNHPYSPSMDHCLPKIKGGKNHISNFVLAHRICNMERSAIEFTPEQDAKYHRIQSDFLRAFPKNVTQQTESNPTE